MFNFLTATDTDQRMTELERFIEFWYGPRRPEYGEPIAANEYPDLPAVLRRFYAFAGRWPTPGGDDDEYFYTGQGGHHLLSFDHSDMTDDGRLRFFMEYQGDWSGVTEPKRPDPPVWIVGRWDDDEEEEETDDGPEPPAKTRQVSSSLSAFLVTHCLMAMAYEDGSTHFSRSSSFAGGDKLRLWYDWHLASAELLWQVEPGCCPNYEGVFHLLQGSVLVHSTGHGFLKFCALHPEGVALLRRVVGTTG